MPKPYRPEKWSEDFYQTSKDLVLEAEASGYVGPYKNKNYDEEVPKIVFDFFIKSKTPISKAHIVTLLGKNIATLNNWLHKYPEFKYAFELGLAINEKRWRDKIHKYAFRPASEVNTSLIKLISANSFNIKEDPQTVVQVVNDAAGDVNIKTNMSPKEAADLYASLMSEEK